MSAEEEEAMVGVLMSQHRPVIKALGSRLSNLQA